MRVLLLLAMVLVTAGFPGCNVRSDAPIADADDECYRAATPSLTDTGVRWTANPEDPSAWDVLANVTLPKLNSIALAGERSRQSCAGFITDLKQRGIIRAKE